jgi:hypothetical protein
LQTPNNPQAATVGGCVDSEEKERHRLFTAVIYSRGIYSRGQLLTAMASTGLSRRRVPGNASSSEASDNGNSHTKSNGHSTSPTTGTSHAGSAFEGGSKIAFDPRDLEQENEDERHGGKVPRLTLLEEVLLLGIKDKQVCASNSSLLISEPSTRVLRPSDIMARMFVGVSIILER